jgi:WD40 repeat protein
VRTTYATGAAGCPRTLAQAGRWLYVGHGCGGQWAGHVGRLDLQRPRAGVTADVTGITYYGTPLLDAGATTLAVGEASLSPANVRSFRVAADGSLTQISVTDHDASEIGSNLGDLSVSFDGTRLLTAAGAPYVIQEFATADLTTVTRSYPTTPYPRAVAFSPDERSFAGGSDGGTDPEVFVFTGGTQVRAVELGATLVPSGLAWSPNSRRVYAVTFDAFFGEPPVLHILPAAA